MRPGKILLAVLLLSGVAAYFTFKLFQDVRTDFATMLPENDRSVVHVKEVTSLMGGTGNIFVSIHSPDFEANKRFVHAFSELLSKYPPELVRFFDFNTRSSEDFFRKHLFYYLTIAELKELRSAFKKKMEKTRLGAVGLDLEGDSSNPDAHIRRVLKKIFDKYRGDNPFGVNKQGYFTDATGENTAIIIRPTGDTADQVFCREIVTRLNNDIAKLNPQTFHKDMEVGLAGTYVSILQNFASVLQDTVETAALTIILVLGSIYLYYRSLRMVAMLCASVLFGILVTFAITYFKIGYLNQQTAFLASIIVGNGINFGLIQMARYLEERGRGVNFRRALNRSLAYTVSATFMAAFATSLTYAILSVTTFRGFSQFGFIGGIGMVLCWIALTIMVPCFIVLLERWRPQKIARIRRYTESNNSKVLADVIYRLRRPLTWVLYAIVPLSIAATWLYASKDRFEYDMKKLSIKVTEGPGSENYFMRRVDKVLGNGTTPSLLMAENRETANRVARQLEARIKENEKTGRPTLLNSVRWLDQFYPQEQEKKLPIIRELRHLFLPKYLSLMAPREREWGRVALTALKSEPFKTDALPEMVLRFFREKDGTLGRLIFVAAGRDAVLSNILDLVRIGEEISSEVPIAEGKHAGAGKLLLASESMIFIDIIDNVRREGPLVTVLCFLAVGVLIFAGFRRLREFLFVYAFLTFGMLAFIASLLVFGIKLNFFNFITIPITIGIGVDYAINIFYRYKSEGERSIKATIAHTGSAVALCSWTTIIGYGTMLWAKNQAMASFGMMAVIGEICCLGFALVFMPAFLGVRENQQGSRAAVAPPQIPRKTAKEKPVEKSRGRTNPKKRPSATKRK